MADDGFISPIIAGMRRGERRPFIILTCAAVVLLAWKYFGSPAFYQEHFGQYGLMADEPGAAAAIYSFLACFLFLGVVPALIVKFAFREKLSDYGVGLGVPARTLRTFLILGPLFALGGWLSAGNPGVAAYYPINPSAGRMFALHVFTYLLYYAGWEFFFRGFMLFGLREKFGDAGAIMVQTLASSLLHIGTPATEAFCAIAGGVLWGLVALRTRSLLSGYLQHSLLGIVLDWTLCRR